MVLFLLVLVMENHATAVTGWALKDVGRILGILHETCYSRNISNLEERT